MTVLPFSITPPGPPARRALRSTLRDFRHRSRSRTELTRMGAHMLRAIGVTFAEAEHEANKPFWRT
jgi:uncharacterized protein YjiS (DUF1127 family)